MMMMMRPRPLVVVVVGVVPSSSSLLPLLLWLLLAATVSVTVHGLSMTPYYRYHRGDSNMMRDHRYADPFDQSAYVSSREARLSDNVLRPQTSSRGWNYNNYNSGYGGGYGGRPMMAEYYYNPRQQPYGYGGGGPRRLPYHYDDRNYYPRQQQQQQPYYYGRGRGSSVPIEPDSFGLNTEQKVQRYFHEDERRRGYRNYYQRQDPYWADRRSLVGRDYYGPAPRGDYRDSWHWEQRRRRENQLYPGYYGRGGGGGYGYGRQGVGPDFLDRRPNWQRRNYGSYPYYDEYRR